MADLRVLLTSFGYTDVRTLLNSGNVVFTAPRTAPADAAARIEAGLAQQIGVPARVTVLTAAELAAAVADNPLRDVAADPARFLVALPIDPADRGKVKPLLKEDWAPEALALGARVAYLWCTDGILESRLLGAVGRALGGAVTTRNWTTLTKLHALTADPAV